MEIQEGHERGEGGRIMLDRWMDEWMHGCMDKWMDGCMDAWINGWMDKWMDGRMDG